MALNNDYTDYNPVPANNTLPVPQGMPAGTLPSALYPIIRQIMAALFNTGTELKALYSVASANINGLKMTYVGTASTAIGAGSAIDSTGVFQMKLTAATTKTVLPFAVGSGNGGLDTGSVTVSTGYHAYLIATALNVTDVIYSLSGTGPAMPTGYIYYVPIGGFTTDANGYIRSFVQNGNEFLYSTSPGDIGVTFGSQNQVPFNVSVPRGIKINALLRCIIATQNSGTQSALLTSPDENGDLIGTGYYNLSATGAVSNVIFYGCGELNVRTSTAGQILLSLSGSSSASSFSAYTKGFVYPRGIQ